MAVRAPTLAALPAIAPDRPCRVLATGERPAKEDETSLDNAVVLPRYPDANGELLRRANVFAPYLAVFARHLARSHALALCGRPRPREQVVGPRHPDGSPAPQMALPCSRTSPDFPISFAI
jgi:hypothetical protein